MFVIFTSLSSSNDADPVHMQYDSGDIHARDEVKALAKYSRLASIAYQIQDDIAELEKTMSTNISRVRF